MSIQEDKLKAIADAIRQKEGSSGLIPASDFAARILAIKSGGNFAAPLVVSVDAGATVTATLGETTVSGVSDESGSVTLILPAPGEWTVTAELGGKLDTALIEIAESYRVEFKLLSRLPAGYNEVEYIQSDLNCGIDTGVKVDFDRTKIELELEVLGNIKSSYEGILYCETSGNTFYFYRPSNTSLLYRIGDMARAVTVSQKIADQKLKISFSAPARLLEVGEASYSTGAGVPMESNLFLFKWNTAGSVNSITAKLFSCKLFNHDVVIREFIPCVAPDNEAGLYDLVEKKFYKNAFAGIFTPGPAV